MNKQARNHFVNVLFAFFVLFVVTIGARIDMFLHSASTDIVYASQLPGETSVIKDSLTTDSGVRANIAHTGSQVTATPSVTPTLRAESKEADGTSEDKTIDVKREICSVFKYDCNRAIEVARAESNFNPNAKNSGSTATGIFQIIRGTFDGYHCTGERTNSLDNIKCAYEIYLNNGRKFNTTAGWSASFHAHHQD